MEKVPQNVLLVHCVGSCGLQNSVSAHFHEDMDGSAQRLLA
jgi:hypothetical protein